MNYKNNKGFTLIELLVVISIIGMMSSVILASVNTARDKAKKAAAQKFDTSTFRAFGADALGIWNFDEGVGAGTTFFDSSENRGDGIGTNIIRIANGVKGSAIQFSNVLGAAVPNSFILAKPISSPKPDITVSAWINYADTDKGQSGFIASQNVNTLWNFFLWNSRLYWRTVNNSHDIFCPLPSGGTWHHVLATQTGSAGNTKASLYIDGALCTENTGMDPVSWSNTDSVNIGRYYNGVSAGWGFVGSMDEVYIYSNYLLAKDVYKLYAMGAKDLGVDISYSH
jgi:prepilin-type N-terminal cleavage/methylation domain-containing protein